MVSVDQIADRLLDKISDGFPNREHLVESIIGTALEHNTVNLIYTPLMGFSNVPEGLSVGDSVNSTKAIHSYVYNEEKMKWISEYNGIENATILEINPFRGEDNIMIEIYFNNAEGQQKKDSIWVSHLTLTKILPTVLG